MHDKEVEEGASIFSVSFSFEGGQYPLNKREFEKTMDSKEEFEAVVTES